MCLSHFLQTASQPPPDDFEKYIALYDYEAQRPDELSFHAGDILHVFEKDESGWFLGKISGFGRQGLFPSNYLQPHQ